jgi:hypothetical protein
MGDVDPGGLRLAYTVDLRKSRIPGHLVRTCITFGQWRGMMADAPENLSFGVTSDARRYDRAQ